MYARELVRALGSVGKEEYEVFTPSIVEDVEGGESRRTVRAARCPGGSWR